MVGLERCKYKARMNELTNEQPIAERQNSDVIKDAGNMLRRVPDMPSGYGLKIPSYANVLYGMTQYKPTPPY